MACVRLRTESIRRPRARSAQRASGIVTVLLGLLLAFSAGADDAKPHRTLPAGIVRIPLTIHHHSPRIQVSHDQKLIVSAAVHRNRRSEVALFRFLPSGTLDPAFGQAGLVTTRADGTYASITSLAPHALAIQPDARIVVAGQASTDEMATGDFLLMRFLSDGRLDTSLDGRGWTITGLGKSIDLAHDAAILTDRRIVLVGGSVQPSLFGSRYDFAVVRYLPDGRLDPQFAGSGKTIIRLGSASEDIAYAVRPDARGRTVVAGRANSRQVASTIALLRLNQDGQLDRTFGDGGKVIANLGAESRAYSLTIQPDHMVLVAGSLRYQDTGGWVSAGVALRYGESGKPDNAFGTGGTVRLPWVSQVNMVKTQRDARILLLGTRHAPDQKSGAMVVTRLKPDGTLDEAFGERGTVAVEFGSYLVASSMALSESNDIFVCGMTGYRMQDPARNPDNGLVLFKLDHRGRIDRAFGG